MCKNFTSGLKERLKIGVGNDSAHSDFSLY
jgi:hypothetical protein